MKIIVSDRIYLPSKIVDKVVLKDEYLKPMYNEAKCVKCPYLSDRHSDTCDECPGYLGIFKLYNEKKSNGIKYYGISVGNRRRYKKVVKEKYRDKIKVKDKRVTPKFKHNIEMTGELYPKQVGAVDKISKKGYGVLLSLPRTGKTVMMTAVAIKKKKRTLILAAQSDWLDGFYETICGSDTQEALTNIPKLEKKYGYPICAYGKKLSDFTNKNHDIILSTYQTFITTGGKKRLKKVLKEFGTIIVDECLDGSTQVLLDFEGNTAPIEDIYKGLHTKVVSFNHETQKYEIKDVLATTSSKHKRVYEIELESGEVIRCSGNHKFWSETRQCYVYAQDLIEGEDLKKLTI